MNSAQLYSETPKKRTIQPQVIVGACLLASLLIGTSLGSAALDSAAATAKTAAQTNSSNL